MLPPDEWDQVLNRLTGTIFRGTERISSAVIMNALGVPTDQEGKGGKTDSPHHAASRLDRAEGDARRCWDLDKGLLAHSQRPAQGRSGAFLGS